jgi:hypothetical protein
MQTAMVRSSITNDDRLPDQISSGSWLTWEGSGAKGTKFTGGFGVETHLLPGGNYSYCIRIWIGTSPLEPGHWGGWKESNDIFAAERGGYSDFGNRVADIGNFYRGGSGGGEQSIPTFSELWNNYPGSNYSADGVFELVGGMIQYNHNRFPDNFSNTCAIRISHAFNMSGYSIPYKKGKTSSGKNSNGSKYWYFFRVTDFDRFLTNLLGDPDIESNNPSDFQGHQGIILFQVSGWSDATGHFTLWDGSNVAYGNYFSEAYNIKLWILD